MNYSWPTGEIAVMGAKGAVEIIFRHVQDKCKKGGGFEEDFEGAKLKKGGIHQNHHHSPFSLS